MSCSQTVVTDNNNTTSALRISPSVRKARSPSTSSSSPNIQKASPKISASPTTNGNNSMPSNSPKIQVLTSMNGNTSMASSSASFPDMLQFIMAQANLMQNTAGAALQNGISHPFPPINPNASVPIPPPGLPQHSESNGTPFPFLDLQTAALMAAAGTQHAAGLLQPPQAIPQLGVYPSQPNPGMFGPMNSGFYAHHMGSGAPFLYALPEPGRRKNATRETTASLKDWLNSHRKNPYPSKGDKIILAMVTGMSLTQVSTWFANARRRLKKENKMTWSPRHRSNEDDEDYNDDEDFNDHSGTVHESIERASSSASVSSSNENANHMPRLRGCDEQHETKQQNIRQQIGSKRKIWSIADTHLNDFKPAKVPKHEATPPSSSCSSGDDAKEVKPNECSNSSSSSFSPNRSHHPNGIQTTQPSHIFPIPNTSIDLSANPAFCDAIQQQHQQYPPHSLFLNNMGAKFAMPLQGAATHPFLQHQQMVLMLQKLAQQSQQPQQIAEQMQQQQGQCAVPMPMPPQALLALLHQHRLAQTNSAFHFQPNGSLIPPPPSSYSKDANTVATVSKNQHKSEHDIKENSHNTAKKPDDSRSQKI